MSFRAVSCLASCVILATVTSAFAAEPYTSITYPANGSAFPSGTPVRVAVDAKDMNGVDAVRLWLNGSYHSLDNVAPYEFNVSGLSEGEHVLMVKSENRNGETLDSNMVSIVASSMTTYTAIMTPLNGATVAAGDDIKVSVNAFDPDGILSTRLWINSVSHSIDSAAPFEFTITNLAPGTHSIVVRSKDSKENFLDSPPVIITVKESGEDADESDDDTSSMEETVPADSF